MSARRLPILSLFLPVLLAACASGGSKQTVPLPDAAPPDMDVAASLVVDQFLHAANTNDLDAMARLFGNRFGPIRDQLKSKDLDKRMFVLASALHHNSYSIVRSEIVPGRRSEAKTIIVNMHFADRSLDIPFTVVRTDKGQRYLIEEFDLVKILSGN
jgi:hypothetical protein